MKKTFAYILLLTLAWSFVAMAQAPTPAPSVAGAVVISVPASGGGLAGWVKAQGGILAAVSAAVICLNVIFSTLTSIFAKLSMAEPVWMQSIGNVLLVLMKFVSANNATPAPMVQAALDKEKVA